MIEFNKKILNHNFIESGEDFQCLQCEIFITINYDIISPDHKYVYLKFVGPKLKLTCEEIIIKGIIE